MGVIFVIIFGIVFSYFLKTVVSSMSAILLFAKLMLGLVVVSYFLKEGWEDAYAASDISFASGNPPWDNEELSPTTFIGEVVMGCVTLSTFLTELKGYQATALLFSSMMLGGIIWQVTWQTVMLPESTYRAVEKLFFPIVAVYALFDNRNPEEVVMSQRKNREEERQQKQIEEAEQEYRRKAREVDERINNINLQFENLSSQGNWFDQVRDRFQKRQARRTARETKKLIKEANELYEEASKLRESHRELRRQEAKAKQENIEEEVKKEKEIEQMRKDAEKMKHKAEMMEHKAKIAEQQAKIDNIQGNAENEEGDGPSNAERERQSTHDKIEHYKAKSESIDEIEQAMKEDLADIDKEEEPERYARKYNLWYQLIMEKLEGKG